MQAIFVDQNTKRILHDDCAFQIDIPATWDAFYRPEHRLYIDERVGNCSFGLRPKSWHQLQEESDISLGVDAIIFGVADLPYREIASSVFLEEEGGEWYVVGRMNAMLHAENEQLPDGRIFIYGEAPVGAYSKEHSSYMGLGAGWRALISEGGSRTAIFFENNSPVHDDFLQIVSTFRFR